jgi:hypothetical protein
MGFFTMLLLIVAAVSAFITSIFLLFFPKYLARINEFGNRVLFRTEELIVKYRIITGLLLLVFCILLLYVIYTTPLKL